MEQTMVDKFEVRAIFRRNAVCRGVESSLLDCIADAMGEVIEENNRRLLGSFKDSLERKR